MADPISPLAAPLASAPVPDTGLATAAIHMTLALLLILFVILVGFWMLRRFGPKLGIGPISRGGTLRLLAQLGVGPRKSVVVVRFLNRDLVLGVTDQSITLLTEVPSDHDSSNAFADTLAQATDSPPGGHSSS